MARGRKRGREGERERVMDAGDLNIKRILLRVEPEPLHTEH